MPGPPTAWVNTLRKEELESHLELLEQDIEGTVDELRARLRNFIRANPEHPIVRAWRLPTRLAMANENPPAVGEQDNIQRLLPHLEAYKSIDQIRKWGCKFDGKDPYAFLERVEELQTEYQMDDTTLLRGLPELLKDDALLWYRNRRHTWQTWADFTRSFYAFFMPTANECKLDDQIIERKQKPGETAKAFITALETLMRRRGDISTEKQLDRLYYNLRPEYHQSIRRRELRSIDDLVLFAEEHEEMRRRQTRPDTKPTPAPCSDTAVTATVPYNRNDCCWRCKQRGHSRANCRRPQKKFCSYCGTDGILTRDCNCPRPENGSRAGPNTPGTRPETPATTASS